MTNRSLNWFPSNEVGQTKAWPPIAICPLLTIGSGCGWPLTLKARPLTDKYAQGQTVCMVSREKYCQAPLRDTCFTFCVNEMVEYNLTWNLRACLVHLVYFGFWLRCRSSGVVSKFFFFFYFASFRVYSHLLLVMIIIINEFLQCLLQQSGSATSWAMMTAPRHPRCSPRWTRYSTRGTN